ncbi:MAG: putative signal transducing protein [Terriglobales bacterium]
MLGLRMSPEKETSSELVTVFDTAEEAEALVVHGLLESEGIASLITSLYAQQEILPGVGGVVIRVAPERAEEARRVIEEFRASPGAELEANGEPGAGP